MTHSFQDPKLSEKLTPQTVKTAVGVVEYAEIGQGPTVVALHGAMGGYDQSLILAQTIGSPDFRYLAVSRPGYLGTPLSVGASPEQQGDCVAALLDALGVARAGVLAVSGGGPSAVQFGLRHAQRCAGLVLVSTCADKVTMPIPFSFKLMTLLARLPWFVGYFHKKAAQDLTAVAQRSIRDPEILARTINDADVWPLFCTMMLSTYYRMGQRLDGTRNDIHITRTASYTLEELRAPVLVVHGTEDQLADFAHAKTYQARLPDVELVAVEGGEHVAIFTHRELVRARVSEFTQRHFQKL